MGLTTCRKSTSRTRPESCLSRPARPGGNVRDWCDGVSCSAYMRPWENVRLSYSAHSGLSDPTTVPSLRSAVALAPPSPLFSPSRAAFHFSPPPVPLLSFLPMPASSLPSHPAPCRAAATPSSPRYVPPSSGPASSLAAAAPPLGRVPSRRCRFTGPIPASLHSYSPAAALVSIAAPTSIAFRFAPIRA